MIMMSVTHIDWSMVLIQKHVICIGDDEFDDFKVCFNTFPEFA